MKKNRIGNVLLAVSLGVTLCACGNAAGESAAVNESPAVKETQAAEDKSASKETQTADEASTDSGESMAQEDNGQNGKRLLVVTTNFAEYDFARQIAGDDAEVKLLVKPGAETHSFEPTPEDMIAIQNSDLFVYVGGDSDEWVEDILESMDTAHMVQFRLMDQVDTVEEELVEGMEEEEEEGEGEEEGELDEHVWTSPVNAMKIVENLAKEMEELDPAHKEVFAANTTSYLEQLGELDQEFRELMKNAKRTEIIVGDRFPFRYFCDAYGLTYYAAFPGCSTDTQPSAQTVAFLIDKVKEDQIPVVFHIELSNEEMCDSIAEATGAKSELLNAVHNVSDEEFKQGATYVSLMQHNVEVLKEALN